MAALSLARNDLQDLLDYLNPREREILSLRFGLEGDQPLTLDEVGRRFNVTRERIRQIEAKALTKLRHPCSARHRRLVASLGTLARRASVRRRAPRAAGPGPPSRRSPRAAGRAAASRGEPRRPRRSPATTATASPGSTPGAGRARNTTSTRCAVGVDDHRRVADQLDVEGRLLLHLAAGGLLGCLAPLQEAAGQAPAVAVAEAHEQHGAVGPLDHADRADGVGRRDRAHDAATGLHRQAPVELAAPRGGRGRARSAPVQVRSALRGPGLIVDEAPARARRPARAAPAVAAATGVRRAAWSMVTSVAVRRRRRPRAPASRQTSSPPR